MSIKPQPGRKVPITDGSMDMDFISQQRDTDFR